MEQRMKRNETIKSDAGMSWEMVRLEDLTENGFMVDGDWIESKDQDPSGNIRLLQLADIGDGYFIDKSNRFINRETSDRLKCTFLKKNDILIARMPDPLGRACIFPFEEENNYVTVVDVCVMRIKKEVDHKYVTYAINSPAFRNKLESQITGTTRLRISGKKLKDLEIPLPPLPIQKRIAEILDAADTLRRKDQALLKKYDELAQAIFIDMFGDPVKNEKGWEVKRLGDVFGSFKYGTNQKSNDNKEGIPVLRIPNVIGNEIDLSNLKYSALELKEIESTKLGKGDLLFVRSNGNPNYTGRSALFLNEGNYSYASYLIRARLKSPNLTLANFIQFALSYKTYRPLILKKATTTAGNYNINTESLKSLSIPIPKQELVDSFFEKMKLKNALSKSIITFKSSDNLFQTLIQKAFKGGLSEK
jgi:type I restriction enzyme S subunit